MIDEFNEDEDRWDALHHPFTSPKDGHEKLLASDPGACLSKAYDLVINGVELGGGSWIRRVYLLFNCNCRSNALYIIYFRFIQFPEKLACIGGKTLDIARPPSEWYG